MKRRRKASALDERHTRWLHSMILPPREKGNQLVNAFLDLYDGDRVRALMAINEACGTCYRRKRFNEWRRGEIQLPSPTKALMQVAVIRSRFPADVAEELLSLLEINEPPRKIRRVPFNPNRKRRPNSDLL